MDLASLPLHTSSPPQPANTSLLLHVVPEGCVVLDAGPQDFIPWDNPDNLISREVEQGLDAAVAVGLLPVLFLLSVSTNALNMAVFLRQGVKERVNVCLFSLSLTDCLYMVFSLLFNVDKMRQEVTGEVRVGPVFRFIMENYLESLRALNWVSGFLSAMIACERCFCVLSPLRSQAVLTARTTAGVVAAAYVVILAGPVAASMRWRFICVFDPASNSTSETLYTSELYAQNKRILDTLTLLFGTVQPILYSVVVVVTTVVTAVKLRRIVRWREQTSSATMTSREVALTRMLIGTSCVYAVCSLPPIVLGVCIAFVPDVSLHGRYYNFFNFMISLFELFTYVNASFNFFVYWFLGSRYRETLREIVRCGRKQAVVTTNDGK